MPEERRLDTEVDWVELTTTAADWDAADPVLLGTMLSELHLIRAFEETVLELAGETLVHGPAHSSIGQEGGAVGSIVGLTSNDGVNGSHRGHHQFLAKALTHVSGGTIDPTELVTPEIQTVIQRTLAEILGLAQGFCRGRGGSMHLQWFEAGALGTNAIVGAARRWRPATHGPRSARRCPAADRATSRSTISATARARSARSSSR